ncbi:universal stress protein [Lacisediminihabitans changchengi]|uniref:Universal stress protein n=1 Tax=Lacisediminihabitans changchengi TaxID=2787634 RepID=A0A934SHY5_9MICO|nr:universal stress protein [Lacisediminihabitans changchengi]MBK4346971.1 universal stress protein [Lacisediminihabitans changchengi]MBK4347906.1 universal stress protein [Lacisediminihabitans changchengi]
MDKKIVVVGVDGSETSIEALRDAAGFARMANAELRIVSAWEYVAFQDVSGVFDPEREAECSAQYAVQAVFGDTVPDWVSIVVELGRPGEAMVRASEKAVLLVVGSRGHNVALRFLLGSTSTYCAVRAKCPVMIVHQNDRQDTRGIWADVATTAR